MRFSSPRLSRTFACLLISISPFGPATPPAAVGAREPWRTSCQRVREVPFPAEDQPDAAKSKALEGCKSEDLFYGIDRPSDPDQARLCAYVERAAGDQVVFGGSAMLMTMYATGVGARRNIPLAVRFACDLDGAPAEMEDRIAHIQRLAAGAAEGRAGATFDLCDDATSGFTQGHCAAHEQRVQRANRDRRYAARLSAWAPAERAAFQDLRATAGAFFGARASNEVDLGGTARAALQIEEGARLERSFDHVLDALERNTVPRASRHDFARADRALNAVYQRLMRVEDPVFGTVTKDGIRQTERTWLKYRDGWVALAKVKFPRADAGAIRTWLTRQRAMMLQDLTAQPNETKPNETKPN